MENKSEISIANMAGNELISYLNTLSERQAEFSKLKVKLTEALIPVDQERAQIRADIQNVTEKQRQTKIEIAAVKYAIRAEKD